MIRDQQKIRLSNFSGLLDRPDELSEPSVDALEFGAIEVTQSTPVRC